MTALDLIISEEGFRAKPYLDTLGIATFGHGLTHITEEESQSILENRITNIAEALSSKYNWFDDLTLSKQAVIISMVYQLGFNGFSKFKKMIKALEEGNYKEAAIQGLDSKWARQTPNRAKRQMAILDSSEEL